jgi:hypothetical protein
MAEKRVVRPLAQFYEAFRPVVRELDREHGPLYLAMIVQFVPEPEDEWVLLVGSRSLAQDAVNGTTIVARTLSEMVAPEVTRKVRRIGIVRESDPLFRGISRAIGVRVGGLAEVEQYVFDGVHVQRGALFASTPRTRRKSGGDST